ncbi:glycoside hydrolase family 2 protein [Sphingomonas sp. CROZ-RG-20F-R02-07]|uniref:beta-mannosidase n=1 Tax=Sphingomonas sp. CROZ-RG-20F-R02-07 TaxID=2914832 RepID=UPI001F57D2F2|nr:glycoside hydrolase family 2 protein [Sphingomonas sp. CROZ-RG-20F-R02-07]
MRWLFAAFLAVAAPAVAAPKTVVALDQGWQVRLDPADPAVATHPREAQWFAAAVPGSVQQDLIAAGRVPDPYVGRNEGAIQWVGLAGWQWRTTIMVTPALFARRHLDLVFDGLDTFATVSVNGRAMLVADNAHRRWRLDAKPALHVGANLVTIAIASPIKRLQPMVLAEPHPLPGEYDSMFGDEPKGRQTSPYIRKPKYQYGWDWGPRIVAIGAWRPVRLEAWDATRIDTLRIEQEALNDAEARISARIDIAADGMERRRIAATVTGPSGRTVKAQRMVTLAPGLNHVAIPLAIAHPQRWWPAGSGAQPLYRVAVAAGDDDRAERRTGLRTVELMRDGGGLGFRINGRPIFAKGANLIPFDEFPTRVTPERMQALLADARDANMNMIRVWGGGYYLDDAFYDAADAMGLMLWQDFMFGGSVTPPDPAFRANVAVEAEEQVARLQAHPAIVLWSGGNEILAGWANWSDRKAYKAAIGADAQERIGTGMAVLFDRVLRDAVLRNAPGTPYWNNSPSTDYEAPIDTDANGDRHFWDVWSGSKPVERYLDSCPRFMSEYGFQAMPVMATIRAFAGDGALTPDSPVMKAHQRFLDGEGNARLQFYLDQRLRPARDFADFVYLTQVDQAQAIAMAALHHRACRPVTMGSLYWQLNDVWPGISWSGIDWYGRWKLLHYAARRFFAPEAIVAEHVGGATRVVLVSDATAPIAATWRITARAMAGAVLATREAPVALAPLAATEVARLDDAALFGAAAPDASYAVAELLVGGRPISRAIVERMPPKDMAYPDPGLTASWDGDRVTVSTRRLARAVMLDFGTVSAHPSDNGFDLLPGERVTLTVRSDAPPAALAAALTLRSLAR